MLKGIVPQFLFAIIQFIMDITISNLVVQKLHDGLGSLLRKFLFQVLSYGPMPRHISFIPDGNRRFGRKHNLQEGEAHRFGYLSLVKVLKYCYEMNIQYVSLYAFSIDNFKRKKSEVQTLMKLLRDQADALVKDSTIVSELGVRVEFLGHLELLDEETREAIFRARDATKMNGRIVLLILLAYTSTDEIYRGVVRACEGGKKDGGGILVEDVEECMDCARFPDPDILVRTSGETRLSNYLLWQTRCCLLYAPRCLWPEISLRHLVWGVLLYQRNWMYLEKIKKKKL